MIKARGLDVDDRPGCAHWRTERDLIAIRLPCCEPYYACYECHKICEDHEPQRWPFDQWNEAQAILCRACHNTMTIRDYMKAQAVCPHCAAQWNPKCRNHWDMYFEVEKPAETAVEKALKA